MGTQAKDLTEFVVIIGVDQFPETDLRTLKQNIHSHFSQDAISQSLKFDPPKRIFNNKDNLIVYRFDFHRNKI